MKKSFDPFFAGKIEREANPVLYVPDDILYWVSKEPLLFEGVRGSGKSAILFSLKWEVAWKISGIEINGSDKIKQLFNNPSHLGVYLQVVEMEVTYWESWQVNQEFKHKYFGTYIDFLYLDLLFNALDKIKTLSPTLFKNRESERLFVNNMIKHCFPHKQTRPRLEEETFNSLRRIIEETHLGIRDLVFRNISESAIRETYPITSPGSLLRKFGDLFIENYPELADWTIMPLLDDCNMLKEWQARTINSAILKSKVPIAYKLASVEGLYPTKESLSSLETLIEHDIKNIHVPSARTKDPEYYGMIEGVIRTRIEKCYSKKVSEKFNLKKFLGPYNIELLLEEKLKRSENIEAHDLLKLAKQNDEDDHPPKITSTWLSLKNVRDEKPIPPEGTKYFQIHKRKVSSEYKKKWNRVAAVAICKEFKFNFPYCGWKTFLHLSYGSIRETLRIMSKIWSISCRSINEFVEQEPVEKKIQFKAIRAVAIASFESVDVDERPLSRGGSTVAAICNRLGKLFSKCQSYPYICTTAETACIKVKKTELREETKTIIYKTVTSGIFVKEETKNFILVGLHPIFSPKFNISFRRPFYYPEPISGKQLEILLLGSDQEANNTINEILLNRKKRYNLRHKKIEGNVQLNMFSGFKNEK